MSHRPDPLALRVCLAVVRLFATLVPARSRDDWRTEWDAEVRHRWHSLEDSNRLDWRSRMDLFRRALGALPDAAWLRRQFTADADIVHDVKHGLRMLHKSPIFTVSAVSILALGIGGTVAIVTLLDTLLFRPLPYADADRILTVWTRHAQRPSELEDVAPADFLDWRERTRSFTGIAAAIPYSYDYTDKGDPEVLFGAQVTEGFWDAFGTPPMLGRGFLPEEHVRGARPSVVISYGLWQSRFGGDPAILNRSINLDGNPYTIVGVLPREFAPQFFTRPGELSVWAPKVIQEHEKRTRSSAWWNVVARLKPGVTLEQAQSEMNAIAGALAKEYPRTNATTSPQLVTLREHLMGDVRLPLYLMLAAVVLVLAIGCANVASLLLARGVEREREFAIRAALGAGRTRLVRQLVAESLLLSAIAAIAGVALAHWALGAIVALAPSGVLRLHDAAIDGRILAFAAALTTLTAVGFGLLPAIQFSSPGRDVVKERQASGPRRTFRQGLVTAEVALALVLLTGAGLLIRSFERLLAVDPGFRAKNVVEVQVFTWDRTGTPERTRAFFANTIERMKTIPGVDAVGAVSAMPFAVANIDIKSPLEVIGRPPSAAGDQLGTYVTVATPGYFTAMSIPLKEGRFLEERDTEKAPLVAVISEALSRREWPKESPVGRRIRIMWHGQKLEPEVVGVVSQIRHDSLDSAARPEVFLPHAQAPFSSMTYALRGAGEPSALIDAAKRQIWSVDPLQTVYDAASVETLVAASVVRQRFSMTIMSTFALLALVLCASGIYGILSFTTTQRTREIGVRMALGADSRTIQRMVLREGSIVILIGIIAGLAGALAGARFLQTLLFEVSPGDPLTIASVCALLGIVGLVACYVPARRATRVDPLVALRAE
jgi:putative ABC transport system permease protein